MKIALVRKKYTFHGGAEGFSQGLIDQLAREGHEVHIHAISWEGTLPAGAVFFHQVPAVTCNSFFRDLTFALVSGKHLKEGKYDIIQSHDKTLHQDIYRAGDGCHIEWLRQRWRRTGMAGKASILCNPYHWLILGLERSIFRKHRYRKIIAISELVKKNIIDHYHVPAGDIVVIYNGVDLDRFHPANRGRFRSEIRRQYEIPDNARVFLFVGSGFERKGVRYLIEAAERLEAPVTLLIAGKGSGEKFQDIINKQRVIFCGPQKQIEQYYAAADAFVFPTMYEPFGNVHLEALASGLPVITTRNSGASEIIDEGKSGFVVQAPEDTGAIAAGMKRLLDADLLQAMGSEARRTAEKFTMERFVREILRLYSDIMEEKKVRQRSGA
jgi:UDP-glucose:(heptosyl)LPS alpha-1,3-glucosyltransferase